MLYMFSDATGCPDVAKRSTFNENRSTRKKEKKKRRQEPCIFTMKIFSSSLLCACCSVAAVTQTAAGAASSRNDAVTCASIVDRVDCSSGVGSPKSDYNMTREFCEGRGCCFDDSSGRSGNQATPCFFPSEGADVEVVHMINSNHFDAGYADLTVAVVNEYFDSYFPLAAKTGAALRKV